MYKIQQIVPITQVVLDSLKCGYAIGPFIVAQAATEKSRVKPLTQGALSMILSSALNDPRRSDEEMM